MVYGRPEGRPAWSRAESSAQGCPGPTPWTRTEIDLVWSPEGRRHLVRHVRGPTPMSGRPPASAARLIGQHSISLLRAFEQSRSWAAPRLTAIPLPDFGPNRPGGPSRGVNKFSGGFGRFRRIQAIVAETGLKKARIRRSEPVARAMLQRGRSQGFHRRNKRRVLLRFIAKVKPVGDKPVDRCLGTAKICSHARIDRGFESRLTNRSCLWRCCGCISPGGRGPR